MKQFQYSSISPHQIRTTSDPTAEGSWSGAIDIGESDSKITGLVSDDNRVLVLKTNGVWAYYSDGTVTHITPEFEKSAHPDNFRAAHMWNGRLLLPLGAGGMMEMANDVLRDVSLKLYAPDEPYIHGRVVALASEPTRLFALVQDETASAYNLLMAEWAQVQGSSDYRWHHVGAIPYATSATSGHATLFAEGIPSGSYIHHRLWAGVESGGSNLLPYFLPMESDSGHGFTNDGLGTTHDSGATVNESLSDSDTTLTVSDGTNFPSDSVIKIGSEILTVSAISGNDLTVQRGMFGSTAASHSSSTAVSIVDAPEVRFTAWDGNLPNVSKTIASLDVSSLNLGSGGRQFTFLYKLDNGPWMNDLPNDGVVETNPVQTLTFPDGTTAKVLELRAFPALTSVGSIGPVLTRFRVAATLRPPDLKLLPVQITLADGLTLLNGARGGSPKTGLSQLRAWNSQAAEVVITDPEGTEHCMVFLPGTLTVQETAREGVRRSEYTVSFTLAEV
ncbi:MAG: hypothetical protein FJ317_08505 [SAR202 cluster bacterium]|nr:hypothetical protein [SAR202 cluster bacterium]